MILGKDWDWGKDSTDSRKETSYPPDNAGNDVPDGGKIILQKAVYVQDGDTAEILQKRIMEEAEWVILPQAVELVCRGIWGEDRIAKRDWWLF